MTAILLIMQNLIKLKNQNYGYKYDDQTENRPIKCR